MESECGCGDCEPETIRNLAFQTDVVIFILTLSVDSMITIRAWLSILAAFLCTARPVPDNARFSSPAYYNNDDLSKVPELKKSGEMSITYYRKHKNGNGPTACAIGPDQWKPSKFVLGAISQNYFGVGPYKGAGPACGLCMRITPVKNVDGKTFDRLKASSVGPLLVKIADLCPFDAGALSDTGGGNEEWCRGIKGEKNKHGRDIHVDLMYETLPEAWKTAVSDPANQEKYGGNLYATYTLVSCEGSGGGDSADDGNSDQQPADQAAQSSKDTASASYALGKKPVAAESSKTSKGSAKQSREAVTSDTDDDGAQESRSGKSTKAASADDEGDESDEGDDSESSSAGRSGKSKAAKCTPSDDDDDGGKCMLDGIPIDPDSDRPKYCRDYDGEPLAFKYTKRTDYKIYEVNKLGKNKRKVVKAMEKAGLGKKLQRLALAMLMVRAQYS
jgi:hypothetical protein